MRELVKKFLNASFANADDEEEEETVHLNGYRNNDLDIQEDQRSSNYQNLKKQKYG